MKNLILACAVACLATVVCTKKTYAQDTKPRWGIKAGADLMTLGSYDNSNGGSSNYQYRVGFQAGLIAVVPISHNFDFLPQVLYTQKGGSATESYLNGDVVMPAKYKTRMNYLDIPFLFGFKVQPGVTLTLGPQASILISRGLTITDGSTLYTEKGVDGYRSSNFGANIGIALAVRTNVTVNLNYVHDFERIYDPGVADGGYDLNKPETHSGLAFTVSYLF